MSGNDPPAPDLRAGESAGSTRGILTPAGVIISLAGLLSLSVAGFSASPYGLVAGILIMAAGVAAGLLLLRNRLRELASSHELYERMFEAMPCYAVLVDRDLRILWSDAQFQRHFGGTAGMRCHQVFQGRDTPCAECKVLETFRDGRLREREHKLTVGPGEPKDLMVYSAPVPDDEGRIMAVLEVAVDVTSVKEMQKQMVLLGQTIAGMAHSIKNIMMGLDGGIYVVNRGLEAGNRDEVAEGWKIVELNFDKISKLVQDILYCSKEREPELALIRVNDVIREIHDLYRDAARSFHIDLKLDLDQDVGEAVLDPAGLHSVLTNLVSNAMDACKVDLFKESHVVEISSRKESDGSVVIQVSDNGIGMEEDTKNRAFEEFFTSKGNLGTGLGLMVTQKIVQEHGGTVSFQSSPGKGSTFIVKFPQMSLPHGPEDRDEEDPG